MVAVIVLVGLLMIFAICVLVWVMIEPKDRTSGTRAHKTDRL